MKIYLLDWRDQPSSAAPEGEEPIREYILKVGYVGLDLLALEILQRTTKPLGLIPPFEDHNLRYTFSCMAVIRDHFPQFPIYAPVPRWSPREFIRAAKGAGFDSFALHFSEPWAASHQVVHDLLEGRRVHVAGGDPGVAEWKWSEEAL